MKVLHQGSRGWSRNQKCDASKSIGWPSEGWGSEAHGGPPDSRGEGISSLDGISNSNLPDTSPWQCHVTPVRLEGDWAAGHIKRAAGASLAVEVLDVASKGVLTPDLTTLEVAEGHNKVCPSVAVVTVNMHRGPHLL